MSLAFSAAMRKRSSEARRASSARFRSVMSSTKVMIWRGPSGSPGTVILVRTHTTFPSFRSNRRSLIKLPISPDRIRWNTSNRAVRSSGWSVAVNCIRQSSFLIAAHPAQRLVDVNNASRASMMAMPIAASAKAERKRRSHSGSAIGLLTAPRWYLSAASSDV